jgi:hypothetical protein
MFLYRREYAPNTDVNTGTTGTRWVWLSECAHHVFVIFAVALSQCRALKAVLEPVNREAAKLALEQLKMTEDPLADRRVAGVCFSSTNPGYLIFHKQEVI